MRIPPHFFSDDSNSAAATGETAKSRFAGLPEPVAATSPGEEETLKLPGVECPTQTPAMVCVRLGDILEPLADAIRSDRTFLSDFADDDVQLPADLLECLQAYQQIRKAA